MRRQAFSGEDEAPPPFASAADLREINEHLVLSSLREHELFEAAEREKARINALLESLNEGVLIADDQGRVKMFNDAARRMLRIKPSLYMTRLATELQALDARRLDLSVLPRDEQPIMRALRGESFVDSEFLLVHADHEARRLFMSGTQTMDGDKVALTIIVLRDVTERAQLEQRLAQTERLAAIGTLAAGLAHEINNPLAYVTGNVDFALHSVPAAQKWLLSLGTEESRAVAAALAEIATALNEAQEGCARVHRIVSDVNGFGRLDTAERGVLDLTEVLEGAIRMTESFLREKAVVRRKYEPAPAIVANAAQLGQVFMNLLVNAAQAIDEGHATTNEIAVVIGTDANGSARIDVVDSGPGIPRDLQRRIFDPFFTTKPVGKGSGLGLSICHSIVTSLGGEISVTSELGKGTTFRVTLPPVLEPLPARPSAVHPLHDERARILVMDDEPAVARAMTRMLRRSHEVVTMTDPREALVKLASDRSFDVIFCDLMMPTMSGMAFFEALKAKDPELATRVVFCSGGAYTVEAQQFLSATTNPTLNKPVQSKELFRLVADLLSSRATRLPH